MRQRKKQESNFERSQNMTRFLQGKLGEEDAGLNYASSRSLSLSENEDESQSQLDFSTNFPDIIHLKTEFGSFDTDQNLIKIAQFSSKDAEKEQQLITNAKNATSTRTQGRRLTLKQRMQLNRE